MSLVPKYNCDHCSIECDERPLFSIGDEFGDPLHGHEECVPFLLSKLQGIIETSECAKKDFHYKFIVSKKAEIPIKINPKEEMEKMEVKEKIKSMFANYPSFIKMFPTKSSEFISDNQSLFLTLSTWDCLYY